MNGLEKTVCPCCNAEGLLERTIHRHLQLRQPNMRDEDMLSGSDSDSMGHLSSPPSSGGIMETFIGPEGSPPATPEAHELESQSMPDIQFDGNDTGNTLTNKFSELSLLLESHLEPDIIDNSDEDPNVPPDDEEPSEREYESDEDSLTDFYDKLRSDEELRDTYWLSECSSHQRFALVVLLSPTSK